MMMNDDDFLQTNFIICNVDSIIYSIYYLLVVISTTTAQTGTVKISLQAYVNFLREQEFPITLLQYFSKEMQKKCE